MQSAGRVQTPRPTWVLPQVFDLLGYEPSAWNKIAVHVGGVYGDKAQTLHRWATSYAGLSSSCRKRITGTRLGEAAGSWESDGAPAAPCSVEKPHSSTSKPTCQPRCLLPGPCTVENDDRANAYSVQDLYELFKLCGVPIVFDFHHWKFCQGAQTGMGVAVGHGFGGGEWGWGGGGGGRGWVAFSEHSSRSRLAGHAPASWHTCPGSRSWVFGRRTQRRAALPCGAGGMTQPEALGLATSTWPPGVRPVVHWSESQADRKAAAHPDWLTAPMELHGRERDVDVMIEAKKTEQALLRFRAAFPPHGAVVRAGECVATTRFAGGRTGTLAYPAANPPRARA